MENIVFDASALIAYIKKEKGYRKVGEYLDFRNCRRFIHAINACEVVYYLMRDGVSENRAWKIIEGFKFYQPDSLSSSFLRRVATLKAKYKSFALGDCIATACAEDLSASILASDSGFAKIESSCQIIMIR